jgi:hypothetical protein
MPNLDRIQSTDPEPDLGAEIALKFLKKYEKTSSKIIFFHIFSLREEHYLVSISKWFKVI